MKNLLWEIISKRYEKKYFSDIETFLSQINLPTIGDENYSKYETDIT